MKNVIYEVLNLLIWVVFFITFISLYLFTVQDFAFRNSLIDIENQAAVEGTFSTALIDEIKDTVTLTYGVSAADVTFTSNAMNGVKIPRVLASATANFINYTIVIQNKRVLAIIDPFGISESDNSKDIVINGKFLTQYIAR